MTYDCASNCVAGTTLVTVRVRNDAAVPRRIRVRNDLPGPVLPPRRDGVPERGWDEDGFTGVVQAADERSFGYACPTESETDSPVSVEWLGRADADGPAAAPEREAVRALGRARPPSDAVPMPTFGDGASEVRAASVDDATRGSSDAMEPLDEAGYASTVPETEATTSSDADSAEPDAQTRPERVESWLSAVETRIEHGEALTDATAAEAAAVLETAGCVDHLPTAIEADETALRAFADRATRLAERAADADPGPVAAALEEL